MKRIALVVCALLLAGIPAQAAEWEFLFNDDAISVWKRPAEDGILEFKGEGVVEAPAARVLAVILDPNSGAEWMKNCVGSGLIGQVGPGDYVVYNRTKTNAPFVSDRDIVVNSTVKMAPQEHTVRVDFRSITDDRMPPIAGVVRMPTLSGYWAMQQLDGNRTDVVYTVKTDVGGSIPKFVANWVARNLPHDTLMGLRAQANKPVYKSLMDQTLTMFDWTGFAPPSPSAL